MRVSKGKSSLREQVEPATHSVFWWAIKVICGVALIANLLLGVVYQLMPSFYVSVFYAQLLVILGGLGSLTHYLMLRALNSNISQPEALEVKRGLYKLVRHPMYLFDCISYVGLFLLFANPISGLILCIGIVALFRQAQIEDKYMRLRFETSFNSWRNKTRLLIPYIY